MSRKFGQEDPVSKVILRATLSSYLFFRILIFLLWGRDGWRLLLLQGLDEAFQPGLGNPDDFFPLADFYYGASLRLHFMDLNIFFRDASLRGSELLIGGWDISRLDPIQGIKLGELEESPKSIFRVDI